MFESSKLPLDLVILTAELYLGGIIASIIAGQMLSAVNGAGLTIAVGCAISALCIGLVAAFGIAILHTYERSAPLKPKRSAALKLTEGQIRLDTASICPTRPHRFRRPQFQYLIAIYRSARHSRSQSLLLFRTSVLCRH